VKLGIHTLSLTRTFACAREFYAKLIIQFKNI
jgi:hypothetical protein